MVKIIVKGQLVQYWLISGEKLIVRYEYLLRYYAFIETEWQEKTSTKLLIKLLIMNQRIISLFSNTIELIVYSVVESNFLCNKQ